MTQTLSWQGLTFKPESLEIEVGTEDMSPIYPWELYETAYNAFRKPELLMVELPIEKIEMGNVVYYLCEWSIWDPDKRLKNGKHEEKLHALVL